MLNVTRGQRSRQQVQDHIKVLPAVCPKEGEKESVINLSDRCVEKITKDEIKCASSTPKKLDDQEWAKKLKCLDDINSQKTGLNSQCVQEMITRIEANLTDLRPPVCSYDALLGCLKKNEECMIRCKRYVDEFIDCVDAQRVNIIREKYELEKKMKSMEEEDEIAKQFLKSN